MLSSAFFKSAIDLSVLRTRCRADSWFGLGPPFVIGIGSLLRRTLMLICERTVRFFKPKWKTAVPDLSIRHRRRGQSPGRVNRAE